jgi:hypothetical protein
MIPSPTRARKIPPESVHVTSLEFGDVDAISCGNKPLKPVTTVRRVFEQDLLHVNADVRTKNHRVLNQTRAAT